MLHLTHIETKIDGKSHHENVSDLQFEGKKELDMYRAQLLSAMPPYITAGDKEGKPLHQIEIYFTYREE